MTVTPIRAARLANARRAITDILTKRQCMYPEEAARMVVDELLNAGWSPPGAVDGDDVPRPSYSTVEGRRRARELYEQARQDNRRADSGAGSGEGA